MTCVIEIETYANKIDEQSDLRTYLISQRETVSKLPPTSFFKAATLVADLPGTRPPPKSSPDLRSKGGFKSYANSVMNGCSFKSLPNLTERDCQENARLMLAVWLTAITN